MKKSRQKSNRAQQPEVDLATRITKLATAFDATPTEKLDDALDELLEGQIKGLTPAQFNTLLEKVNEQLKTKRNGDYLISDIEFRMEVLATSTYHEEMAHDLGALPILIGDTKQRPVWQLGIEAKQQRKISQALKDTGVIDQEATVTILPLILSPDQAASLHQCQMYQITQMMSQGHFDQAEIYIRANTPTNDNRLIPNGNSNATSERSQSTASAGVILVFVSSTDGEHFPFNAGMSNATLDGEFLDDVLDDVEEALRDASSDLQKILGLESVNLLKEPDDWFGGVRVANEVQRRTKALVELGNIASSHTKGETARLCVGDVVILEKDKVINVEIHRKADLALVGKLLWPSIAMESLDECLENLEHFLNAEKLSSLREAQKAKQIAQPQKTPKINRRSGPLH